MKEGDIVGERYVIERPLASGGMAEVFRAHDRVTGETVALKLFGATTPELRVRFERESEVLATLEHPGIVRYVGHGAPPDASSYLAMEYLDGEDLFARLLRGPLSVDETLVLAQRVASALVGAHARGILHRDIKPANLFLVGGAVERVKVLDFGIVRVAPSSNLTQIGYALGTPDYMSPEQARGDAVLTPAVDVFALGSVLFECLIGEPPFTGQHPLAILTRILLEHAPRVSTRRPDLPAVVDDLVARLLSTELAQRPRDASEVLSLVEQTRTALLKSRHGDESSLPSLTTEERRARLPSRPELAPTATRTFLGRTLPLFGRQREIAEVERQFEASMAESRARAVIVTGAPGIGKSRLRVELSRIFAARVPSAFVLAGRGDAVRRGQSFGLLASALRASFGLRVDDEIDARRERVLLYVGAALADEHDPAASARNAGVLRVSEFVGELVGTPFVDDASPVLRGARADRIRMGDQMWRAFLAFVGGVSRHRPVLVVVDDLDNTDLPSLVYLDAVLRTFADRRIFIVAFGRPEVDARFPNLWAERPLSRVSIGPLDGDASAAFVREALGPSATAEAVRVIVDRSDGNPLFMEELVRAVSSSASDALPHTIAAVVEARLGALSVGARRVLRAASILGRVSWRSALGALCGGLDESLDRALAELFEKEILVTLGTSTFQDEAELAFRHALVRDVAYGTLTEDDRVLGHDLAGRWLAEKRPGEAVTIAEHFAQGGQPGAAVAWYARAAELALGGNDFVSAIERAERAIACGAEGLALGRMHLLVSECHRHRGANVEMVAAAEEAREILVRGTPAWFQAVANAILGGIRLGRKEAVDACIADLAREMGRARDGSLPAVAARIAHYLHFAGRHEFATRLLSGAWSESDREDADGSSDTTRDERAAWFHRACATRALVNGDLGSYLEHLERAVARFEAAGDVREPTSERVNVGFARLELGLYREAEKTLRQALDDATALGLLHTAATARDNLGAVLVRIGSYAEAERHLVEATSTFARQKNRRMEGNARVYLGELYAVEGELEKAEATLRTACDLLAPVKPLLPMAKAALAEVLLARGQAEDAEALVEDASRVLDEMGHLDEGESLVRLVRVETLLARGRREEARVAADSARQAILARASRIREPTWRSTFLAVRENARTLELAALLEQPEDRGAGPSGI